MEVKKAHAQEMEKLTRKSIEWLKTIDKWRHANLINFLLEDLEKRVKKDKATKLSVFSTGLSAYLPQPINLFLKGESGIGKTYNVVETLRYFPSKDIWFLGGLSPKALIHDHGVFLDKSGDLADFSQKPSKPKKSSYKSDEEGFKEAKKQYYEDLRVWKEYLGNCYTLIDLSHKILVFLEAPEFQTFRMLFPILSHDTERIEYKFTDRATGGKLATSKVVIQGWPATIFLTTDRKYMEELATRSFTVTPESSRDKIVEANELTNLKSSFPWDYNYETEEKEVITKLVSSLRNHLVDYNIDVVIPFTNLHELFPREIVRDMRDFQHFTQYLKTITALHFYQRVRMEVNGKKFMVSTVGDVEKALEVYKEIFETTRTGTEQQILKFYHSVVKGDPNDGKEWALKQLTLAYNKLHPEKKVSSETIRRWLERLSQIGYVDIQKADYDKRVNVYYPLLKAEEKSTINHISSMWKSLPSKLENGFKTWLKNIHNTTPFYYYKNVDKIRHGEEPITIEEMKKVVMEGEKISSTFNEPMLWISSKEDLQPKTEKKPEIIHIPKMRIIVDNSMFQCQVCEHTGKPMFFANEHDLKLHVERLHNNNPDYGVD